MSGAKRVDPRRPYRITPEGLRRIVLGEIGSGDLSEGTTRSTRADAKPRRTNSTANRWHMAVSHSYRGRLDDHAREAIAAAAILADAETGVLAVILGDCQEEWASLGADRVAVFPDLDLSRFQPEREQAAVLAILEDYRPAHVFMPDNLLGDGDLGRRLIARNQGEGVGHVLELDAAHVAISWGRGLLLANAALPRFVLLEVGAVDSNLPFVGAGEIISVSEPGATEACRDIGLELAEAGSTALEEADCIVSAGNGVANIATLENLANALGAVVGASRVAVDEGKFPREKQIGASGKTVGATTYFAIGISGAVQHLQGIRACRHVIAINRDPGAPIVKRADLTIIGDAEDIMQALITRVAQARAQSEAVEAER